MLRNSHSESHHNAKRAVCICTSVFVCVVVCLPFLRDESLQAAAQQEVGEQQAEVPAPAESKKTEYRNELIRGQVVWLAEALKSEFGISTVPEAAKNSLAILTKDGRLFPIVENLRGRAFRKDPRLRQTDMEILVRRSERQPLIQILRVYQIEDDKRYEVDYWCDVCAIVMFETGPCACCQDDNRLRKRLVESDIQESP
jgi:hypothetical protein